MFVGRTMLRRGVGALVLVLASCGVVVEITPGPDPSPPAEGGADGTNGEGGLVDGPSSGDGATDAADAAGPCTDDMPFRLPPEAITLTGTVTAARVSADGGVTFLSGRGLADPSEQIYEGPFPPVAGTFAPVFDTNDDDSHPTPTPDLKRIYFETDGGGGRAIATATRNAPDGVFLNMQIVPLGASGGIQTREPYAVGNGSVVYFTREPGTVGARDIYRAQQLDGGAWSTAVVDVSSGLNEGFPVVSDDELSIYFSRAGGPNGDIFVAKRTDKGLPFEIPNAVPEINEASADDRPTWLSPDRCTLLFTSNRGGAAYALYRARRRL